MPLVAAWVKASRLGATLIRTQFSVRCLEQRSHNAAIDLASPVEGQRFDEFNVAGMRVRGAVCKAE